MQAAPNAASGRLVQPVGSNDSGATLLNTNIGSGCGTQSLAVMEIIRVRQLIIICRAWSTFQPSSEAVPIARLPYLVDIFQSAL
jgi:hypothetical protein